jgi:amidase
MKDRSFVVGRLGRFGTVRVTAVIVFVLALGAFAHPAARSPERFRFVVEETTIDEVHEALQTGTLTCRHLVDRYLTRIDRYDRQGPALNAIASVNPQAIEEADALDRQFKASGIVGPLHCVPVIVKDNIETQGWETTAGSKALRGFIPARDATAITKLRAAGGIVLAKASMSDLALNALNTVNLIQGRTKNPYALDRVPAGSSGGVAVAIAANFALVGIGTDTGNSVRGPASHTALVGIRPTMGLTSRSGMVPLDTLSDVIGPIARTVQDAAAVLDVLIGRDSRDPATEALDRLPAVPRAEAALGDGPRGMRIGVFRQAYLGTQLKADPQILKALTRAISDLKSLGVDVVDAVSVDAVRPAPSAEDCQGLKHDLNAYLESQGDLVPVHSLAEIISSGRFDPSVADDLRMMQASHADGPGSAACEANAAYRQAVAAVLTHAMDKSRVDVLIYPTWSQLPQPIFNVALAEAGQTLRFATASGFPAMTVPMGFSTENLPMGLSFIGRPWSEAQMLRLAYAYEQATRHRHPPITAPPIY